VNTAQWTMLLAPAALAYILFVWKAESNGRTNHWANLFSGLIVVPLILGFLPAMLLGGMADAMRKRRWGVVVGTSIALVLFAAYGGVIFHLRDRPPPLPWDLPEVEKVEKAGKAEPK
jgi:chromate transport protein ChrA